MFNMNAVGKTIATKRKSMNLTQSELADKLGVTYQAVSNWERGDTMPDIAKLGELASIFDITIDELLQNNKSVNIIKDIMDEKTIDSSTIDKEQLEEVLPLLKPNQIKDSFTNFEGISLDSMTVLFPYLDEEEVDNMVFNYITNNQAKTHQLYSALPFMSSEGIKKCLLTLHEQNAKIDDLDSFYPFLDEDHIIEVINKCANSSSDYLNTIVNAAPFIDSKRLEEIIDSTDEKTKDSLQISLLPFLDDDYINSIINERFENSGVDSILNFLPFASDDHLENIALNLFKNHRFEDLAKIAPFIDLSKIVRTK